MHLCEITLRDFRNYRDFALKFDSGVNLIVGENAQGKTNLLEAIAYLGSGKGFRTQKSAELVRLGAEFAELTGTMCTQERCQSIRWVLFPAARPRQLYRNGVKKKTAGEISGMLQTVLFCPEDLMILKTGLPPAESWETMPCASFGPITRQPCRNTTGFWNRKTGF